MNPLRVSLFQSLHITTPDGQPLEIGSLTTRSLLAYLLLHRTRPLDRRRLAFVLWPRATESAARRNLRQYLHRLRRSLEPVDPHGTFLLTDGTSVQINPSLPLWVDVEVFRHQTRPDATLAELKDATALYVGDLLADIYDEWVTEEREALRRLYIQALERLSQGLQAQGYLDEALDYAKTWAAQEPLDEAAHRQIITLLALNGDRSRALQHYQSLCRLLERELAAQPDPKTQALIAALQDGTFPAIPSPAAPPKPPQPARPPALPLVGRERELTHLRQAQDRARQGEGAFLLITGESGIGKTRLLQEYLQALPAETILHGTAHELEARVPYALLRAVFEDASLSLLEAAFTPPPPWLPLLAQVLPSLRQRLGYSNPAAHAGEAQLNEAFTQFTLHLARHTSTPPFHLVLDDLHWADSATWHFLAYLARYTTNQPLLVIGLCRLEDLPPDHIRLVRTLERNDLVQTLPLSRLSREQTAALACYLLPHRLQQQSLFERLYRETEGNPFFIVEMLHIVRETGHLPALSTDPVTASGALPRGIQRVIEARLDRLSDVSRDLLASAAAIGHAFTFPLLEEISQEPPETLVQAVEEWLRRGLVHETQRGYDFTHDKIRQVAYAGLSRARRQVVHRHIAEALERTIPPTEPATLAYHYARSDQPARALPFLTEAGEQALRVRSYREARQFGLQAVSLLGRFAGPKERTARIDLNLQLAQAYAYSGDLDRAQHILAETEHLAAGLHDEARLGEVFYRSSQIFWLRGHPALAGDYARRTLRVAEEREDERLLQAALRMLGRVGIALSAFDDAIAYLVRYLNLPHVPPPPQQPIVLGYLGVAYARVGSWQRAIQAGQKGVTLSEASGSPDQIAFSRMQLGFVYADLREWDTCLNTINAVADPQMPLTPAGFMLLGLRGRALTYLGRPEEGIKVLQPAVQWAEANDYRVFHYLPRLYLAESHLRAGQIAEAQRQVTRALEDAREAQNRWATAVALRVLAECLSHTAEPPWARIEEHLIESMHTLRHIRARPELARTYLALRRLYDRAGQMAWAVDCHYRATIIFEDLNMRRELRQAQGQAASDRTGAVVIPDMPLKGPNLPPASHERRKSPASPRR